MIDPGDQQIGLSFQYDLFAQLDTIDRCPCAAVFTVPFFLSDQVEAQWIPDSNGMPGA